MYQLTIVGILLTPAYAQYGGPAILSRGQAPTGMSPAQIDFRPFVTFEGNYDTGLNGVSVDQNGKLVNDSGIGVSLSAGVSGLHSWKHTMLGLDYRISFRHYGNQSFYDGSDQALMLGLTQQLSRHVMFALRQSAGLSSQNYTQPILSSTIPFDPGIAYLPTTDFFDNRTIYFSTQADLRVQRSTRLSYDVGVDGFLTRRRSTALFGNKGVGARGDVQYRASRSITVGAAYSYTHYKFIGILSSTDVHGGVGTFSTRLSKTMEFSANAGFAFYETKFVRVVPIDPVVAAVICPPPGTTTQPCVATQLFYGRNWSPNISARLSKTVPRGVLTLSGGHSITPGNGLFLTSASSTVNAGYGYTGLKRWSLNASSGYSWSDSVGNIIGRYASYSIGASVSRQIITSTHFVLGFNAHSYDSPDFKNYNRWAYNIHLGLGFTPGDVPIRLW
jgi:hypothetical protein